MDFIASLVLFFLTLNSFFLNTKLQNKENINKASRNLIKYIEKSDNHYIDTSEIRKVLNENNVYSYEILPFFHGITDKNLDDDIKIFINLNFTNYNQYGYYEGEKYLLIILVNRILEIKTNKKKFKKNDSLKLYAKVLKKGAKFFTLYINPPSNKIKKILLPVINHEFNISYKLREKGKYIFEIVRENNNDPRIISKFEVIVGNYQNKTVCDTSLSDKKHLLKEINRIRTANGLNRIEELPLLSSIAEKHSKDMAENGFFSHISSNGETPFQRVLNSGIKFKKVLENISQAPKLCLAHNEILESPGHLMNLLDKEIDKVGLGIYKKRNLVYLTEDFIVVYSESKLKKYKSELSEYFSSKNLINSRYLNLISKRKNYNEYLKFNDWPPKYNIYISGFKKAKSYFFVLKHIDDTVFDEIKDFYDFDYYGYDMIEYDLKDNKYIFLTVILAQR